MITEQSIDEVRATGRRWIEKAQFVGAVTDLIVTDGASPTPRPQAFLVEQIPNWTLPTHYHEEHQFQVFVGGSGTIGKSPIERLGIHYASPHSGYGPLVAGNDGISYFTLRAVGDTGAWYLPEQREHMQVRIKKRQAHGAPTRHLSSDELRSLAEVDVETLIELEADGLAAWVVRVPPGSAVPPFEGGELGGGRFYVLTKGRVSHGPRVLSALATLFVSRDDEVELRAAEEGSEIVVLQFPAEATKSFKESIVPAV